jgi:DNA-binding GntR family transcriptional regulator
MSADAQSANDDVNLSELLRRGIEDDILTGRLKPGDRLDEQALADQYKVSRTPIREALLQLSSIGLVTTRPRQGCIVTPLSFARFVQMVEVMRFTEASAARLAARRMAIEQRDELLNIQKAAADIVKDGDFNAFSELNWKLHMAIFRGSGNDFLAEQARSLRLRLQPYRRLLLHISGRMTLAHAEHEVIVGAIMMGDASSASDAMSSHLELDGTHLGDLAALLSESNSHGLQSPIQSSASKDTPSFATDR